MPVRLHEDDPDLLRDAVRFTTVQTGFAARLLEKDYFCSVLLEYFAERDPRLTFKGGTCLAKIHGALYRLSEDLDFSLHTPPGTSRGDRSRSVQPLRHAVEDLPGRLPAFRVAAPLAGANSSTQYNMAVEYASLVDGHVESISVEVSVREPIMTAVHRGQAATVLLNPASGHALVDAYPVRCLSYMEAMAEKLRAALTRREVAIRDFFDLDHAIRNNGFDMRQPAVLELARRKLAVPGTGPIDLSLERLAELRGQVEQALRPVLREQDIAAFDLDRPVSALRELVRTLG